MGNKSRTAWKTLAAFFAACILILSCSAIGGGTNTETPPTFSSEGSAESLPASFSPDTASNVPPVDIIQQMGAIPAYGGSASCLSDSYPQATVDQSFLDAYDGNSVEQMEGIVLGVCGLSEGDPVTTNIYFPDGKVESQTGIVKSDVSGMTANSFDFYYVVGLDQPTGSYRFEFQTPKGTAEAALDVVAPDRPRLYIDMEPDQSNLILYNFKPNENVRILIYMQGKLDAWQKFTTDDNGNLTIPNGFEGPGTEGYDGTVSSRKGEYVAIGEVSGQVGYQDKGWYFGYTTWAAGDVYCPSAHDPVVGLGPTQYAEVISDHAYGQVAGSQSTVSIPKGTRLRIFVQAAPYCENGSIWWLAMCSDFTPALSGCPANGQLLVPEAVGQDQYLQAAP